MKKNKVTKILFSFFFLTFFLQACDGVLTPGEKTGSVADVRIRVIDKKLQQPVANASISLKNETKQIGNTQITDASGETLFKSVPLGDGYVAFVNKALGYKSGASPVIKVVPNTETNILLDRLGDGEGSGLIAGSVKDKITRLAISRLTVNYVGPKINKSAITDDNGSFVIEGLVAGNYTLTFSKIGFVRTQKQVTVQEGQSANIETIFLAKQTTQSSVGNYLVSLSGAKKVVEINKTGAVVWSYDKLGSIESSARTNNGDTIITDSNSSRVLQISNGGSVKTFGAGTIISSLKYPTWVDSIDGQNILVTDNGSNKVVEFNGANTVWSYSTGLNRPRSSVYLNNGNILISDSGNHRVIEVNKAGNIVWSCDQYMDKPVHATRLANGNTLVTDSGYSRIVEIDYRGKVMWWFAGPQGNTSAGGGNSSGIGNINPNSTNNDQTSDFDDSERDTGISSARTSNTAKKATINSTVNAYGDEETPAAPGNTLLFPRSAVRLENGNTLIADTGNNRIVEISKDKKVVWELGKLSRPVSVERL
ncbi:MAG: hypothetical protein EOO43_05150 [Flavobacterium sp.]|nr:MAG: hypothetical protein EOO43_05150 [Flavobacterium sp.]